MGRTSTGWPRLVATLLLVVLLSGCAISSGKRQTHGTAPGGGGNLQVSFVTSDTLGSAQEELLDITDGSTQADVEVIGMVRIAKGQFQLEILDRDGSVALTIDGKPNREQVGMVRVATDDQGRLRYRVRATEARHGQYQIIYRPLE